MATAADEGFVILPEGASASLVTTKCVYTDNLQAPIAKGQKIGVVEMYIADDLSGKVDLIAAEAVEEGWFLSFLGITNFQTIIIGVVLALIVIFYLVILSLRIKNKKKKAAIRKRKLMEEARRQLEREEDLKRRNWHF
jgi:D-alanyl-D-alanine carboxypeptidase (penicillin-binding protein 5/6)